MQYPCGWVAPFGHCRINACCQLPDTFRRLPRPSSPLTAKASTVCAYSLDHITPSRLGTTWLTLNYFALASTTRVMTDKSHNARYVPDCQRTRRRPRCRNRFKSCAPYPSVALAATARTVVGLGGLEPPTSPLSGARSNHLSYRPVAKTLPAMVEPVGIEPTTPCLQSRCSPS